jgi:hypothetical protein
VHSEQSFGNADDRSYECGDKLSEMIMVNLLMSEQGFCGANGYGLGLAFDFNLDGYPDIYVMIFMKMIYYLNNGDGTLRV